jgi:hypothetical protein
MSVKDYVDVAISLDDTAVSQEGFGTMLIVSTGAPTAFGGDLYREYNTIDDVGADFATSTPEYKAALAAFSASPMPAKVVIGSALAVVAGVGTVTLAADLVTGNDVALSVNGVPVSVTYATSHQDTMTALATAIAGVEGIASAVLGATPYRVITITTTAGYPLAVTGITVTGGAGQTTGAYAETTPAVTLPDALDEFLDAGVDFYGVMITDRTAANALAVSAWAEAAKRIFGISLNESGMKASSTTDTGSKMKAKAVEYSFAMYRGNATEYPEATYIAQELAETPGSVTWMFKTLPGITPDDLTATEKTNLRAKNINFYTTENGVNMTEQGKAAGGRFLDIVHGRDWLAARLGEDVFALLKGAKKIPYTDKGVAVLELAIRKRISDAQAAGVVSTEEPVTVSVPKVASQSANDRAARKFPGITWGATLAGAIHSVTIRGVLTP